MAQRILKINKNRTTTFIPIFFFHYYFLH